MAKTDYKTIDQYHSAFANDVQERMQTIRNIVQSAIQLTNSKPLPVELIKKLLEFRKAEI